jgi:hypothetical protein
MKNDNWSNDILSTMTTPQLGRSIGHRQNSNISEYSPINLGQVDLTKCRATNRRGEHLLNRSSCLAPASGVTKFEIARGVILVTLCCAV